MLEILTEVILADRKMPVRDNEARLLLFFVSHLLILLLLLHVFFIDILSVLLSLLILAVHLVIVQLLVFLEGITSSDHRALLLEATQKVGVRVLNDDHLAMLRVTQRLAGLRAARDGVYWGAWPMGKLCVSLDEWMDIC